ncbi:MAG: SpoIVB peptidase S55 domain-containing protein [Bryobacteraceae bacterium]|jgi:hypothetical protein
MSPDLHARSGSRNRDSASESAKPELGSRRGYNRGVPRFVVPGVFALAAALSAQTAFFPLKDVRPGMRGTGKTVFAGNRIEDFQVEVLGVLDNVGPKQSLILARLSGGPLEHTGVMQGMSGSPVYFDGKLAGAVAMAFNYAKDPIAGIRPIEEMTGRAAPAVAPARRPAAALGDQDLLHLFSPPAPALAGDARLVDIATPLSFGGFSRNTLETFAPRLRSLGLETVQGAVSGGNLGAGLGNPTSLKPGSMISVQLMAGDMTVGADGTLTCIDGDRVYAFGHRFLGVGSTALPFARSEVVALLPTLNSSFKLSSAKEWMGVINQDRDTAISGELGKLPALTPVTISVSRNGRAVDSYKMQMVDDPLLSPLLIQMAVSSAIDATERTVGVSSIRLSGELEFANAPAPVRMANIFAVDSGAVIQAALSAAVPAAYVMQSGFDALKLKRVALKIETFDQKKGLDIDGVTVSPREARPGQAIRLNVSLAGENGAEIRRQVEYQVPAGAEPGTLYFTVADAMTTNLADFRQVLNATARAPGQVIATVNDLHTNNKAYVRVWRATPAFQLEGADLPDPPASAALILAGSQASLAGITQTRNSKIGEMEIDAGDMAVAGSKTVQVEIKE